MTSTPTHRTSGRLPADASGLVDQMKGRVLLPGDEGYEEARRVHDISVDRYPALIVQPADGEDVGLAVAFARSHGLPLAVRSGCHDILGRGVLDDALVVDVGVLKRVTIDPITSTARVQPGVTSGDLCEAAQPYGLALTTGDTASVGLGGLTLGGGIGFMARKHGLTVDNLLAVELVTADGRLIRASASEHPDLFWALRGGGGNFGVVTEFTFRLARVGNVLGGMMVLPATREAVRGYLDYTPGAPDELTTMAFVMHAPPAPFIPAERIGEPVLAILACWVGDAEAGRAALAPLYALGEPIADVIGEMPYPALYQFTAEASAPHAGEVRSMFSADLSDAAIDAILESVAHSTSPMSMVQLRGLGGAVGRVAPEATAFAHRSARVMTLIVGLWVDPYEDGEPHRQWARDLFARVAGERQGVYVNFLADEGAPGLRSAYPDTTMERLARVKRAWDPGNVFRANHNIAPAPAAEASAIA